MLWEFLILTTGGQWRMHLSLLTLSPSQNVNMLWSVCPFLCCVECFIKSIILGFINQPKTSHFALMNSRDCLVVSYVTGPNVTDPVSSRATSCCCFLFKSHLTASRRSWIKMQPGDGVSKQQETVCTVSRACLWVHVVLNSQRCSELLKQKLWIFSICFHDEITFSF